MKKTILIISGLALVFNVLFGVLLSKYDWFKLGVNCGVIVLNTALLFGIYYVNFRDAFRITFSFLFAFLAFVEFILGCLMPQQWQDNGCLIAIVILLFIKLLLLVVTNFVSDKIKQ